MDKRVGIYLDIIFASSIILHYHYHIYHYHILQMAGTLHTSPLISLEILDCVLCGINIFVVIHLRTLGTF